MTLLEEIDNVKYEDIPLKSVMDFDDAVEVCADKIRAFADKLEGEEMVQKVAIAILAAQGCKMAALDDDALWLAYPKPMAMEVAKAALTVVRERVGK